MLGMKKEKVPFGQRKSKGAFGTKANGGSFGKKVTKKVVKNSLNSPLFDEHKKIKSDTDSISMFNKPRKILKKKSKKNIVTAEEQEYMDWLHSDVQYFGYPCFVCGKFDPSDTIGWHHVKEFSSDKKNHKRQIPLCDKEHHRLGTTLSAHGTPKKWRATYSMDTQNKFAESIWNDFLAYKNSNQGLAC